MRVQFADRRRSPSVFFFKTGHASISTKLNARRRHSGTALSVMLGACYAPKRMRRAVGVVIVSLTALSPRLRRAGPRGSAKCQRDEGSRNTRGAGVLLR